jgi:hypothetical protein
MVHHVQNYIVSRSSRSSMLVYPKLPQLMAWMSCSKFFFVVYDLDTFLPSDLAAEKILLIHEKMIIARIQAYGPPPAGGQEQHNWYQDVLRQSLQIAAKTKLVLRDEPRKSSTQEATPMSLFSQDMDPNTAPATSYNSPRVMSAGDMLYTGGRSAHQSMAPSHSAQHSSTTNNLLVMGLPPLFPENQHGAATIPTYSSVASDTIPGPSAHLGGLSDWNYRYLPADGPLFFDPQQQ